MSTPTLDASPEKPVSEPPRDVRDEYQQSYLYRHAGIEEREGRIPLWLAGVVAGLLIWSLYYMIRYWSEP